jgi:flagellar basal-body rod protein FlgC
MGGDLRSSISVSASGMSAQSERIKIAAQNLANEDSTALKAGADPYRRKTISFKSEFDKALGAEKIVIAKRTTDPSEFKKKHDPSHPAADEDGMVNYPNVDRLVEIMDAKEASRGYEANLAAIEISINMLNATIDILNR